MNADSTNHPAEPDAAATRRSWLSNVLASLVGLAVVLALVVSAELAARVVFTRSLHLPELWFVPDPVLVYRLNQALPPFASTFRGAGPPPDRTGPLVVCLGGSTTFGWGVGAADAWPQLAQKRLRDLGVPVSVVNGGVPGYGSRQLLMRYRSQVAALHPDYVIVYEGWNRTGIGGDAAALLPMGVPGPGASPLHRFFDLLVRHSILVRRSLLRGVRRREARKDHWRPEQHQAGWEADMDSLVHEIVRNQRVIVVLYPSLYHDGMTDSDLAAYDHMGIHRRPYDPGMLAELHAKHGALRRMAADAGAILVDAQAAFDSLHGRERVTDFIDEEHLTTAGQHRVADLLAGAVAADLTRRNAVLHGH